MQLDLRAALGIEKDREVEVDVVDEVLKAEVLEATTTKIHAIAKGICLKEYYSLLLYS
jgi:hypothetical protein